MPRIDVERVRIRLRGVDPRRAGEVAAGLGSELARSLRRGDAPPPPDDRSVSGVRLRAAQAIARAARARLHGEEG